MIQYYLGTIIIGIILIIVAIVLILLDKKNAVDYASKIEDEKSELTRVLSDSEQMLDELNKFSDYIINQVDKRSVKLSDMFKKLDDKLETIENQPESNISEQKATPILTSDVIINQRVENKDTKVDYKNKKHMEVLEMVEKGMSDMEIAKALNMGKGEVQLILGMNIHKLKVSK